MLISYSRPAMTWILGGTGATWLTDDTALTNGRPSSATRVQWDSGALSLRALWDDEFPPRVLALLGVTLPVGTLVSLAFKRSTDSDYTYLAGTYSQAVVQLPDGSRCAWFVLDEGLDAVVGVEFSIASGAGVIDIGEAWVAPTVEIPHTADWKDIDNDPSVTRRSKGSQPFTAAARGYRTLQVPFAIGKLPAVRGAGLDGSDWQMVRAAVRASSRVAAVPRFDTPAEIQRTALFGVARFDAIAHLAGPNYLGGMVVDEAPATEVV